LTPGATPGLGPFGLLALGGPAEELALHLVRGDGLGQAEQVAHRPAFTLAVLDELQGQRLVTTLLEPELDRVPQATAPATQAIRRVGELKQVGAGLQRRGHGRQGGLTRGVVALGGGEREHEDRGVGLGGATGLQHLDGDAHDPQAVLLQEQQDVVGVLRRELALGDVEGAALGAEDQEAIETLPFVEFEDEAAGIVFDHVPAGDGETLGGLAGREAGEGLFDVLFHGVVCP